MRNLNVLNVNVDVGAGNEENSLVNHKVQNAANCHRR